MLEINKKNIRMWSLLGPSGAFGTAAMELAGINEKVLMLTSDLCFFSGLERFKETYPDKLYNFGIAEQNMVGAAGGFAKEGYIPFVNTYASFCVSRCMDQVRVNMSYMGLPIKMVGLTAGYGAGILGATHMSVEDVAVMRALPNMTVISPADCTEIIKAVVAASYSPDPTYIRLTGPVNMPVIYKEDYEFRIGKAVTLREGNDVCIIAAGAVISNVLKAAELLENENISCTVINMHTIKPLDREVIDKADEMHRKIVVVEEHSIIGGLYGAVSEYLAAKKIHKPILPIGIKDFFAPAGSYQYQMEKSGLDQKTIKERIQGFIE